MTHFISTPIQGASPVIGSKQVTEEKSGQTAAKVFFTKHIDAEHLIALYRLINSEIYGKVAIKLHTGERHGPNILPRDRRGDGGYDGFGQRGEHAWAF